MPEGQALGALRAGGLGQGVDLLAADRCRDAKPTDHSAGIQRLAENLELGSSEDRGQLLDLELVTEVGLVDTVPEHGVRVGDAANRCRHDYAEHLLPDVR